MFFRGFRASLHLNGRKHYDAIEFESANPICGAYRTNGDEFYDNISQVIEARSSFIFEPPPPLRPSKGTIKLDLPDTLRKKEVSMNPKGADFEHQRNRHQDREPRKPEKDRTSRNNRITAEIKQSNNKKSKAPVPPPTQIDKQSNEYSNNTEEQSISRIDSNIERSLKTTGPPPYELVSDKLEVIPQRKDMEFDNTSLINEETSDNNLKYTEPVSQERKIKKSFLDLNDNKDDNVNINNGMEALV